MQGLTVDHDRCTRCGQCIYACSRQILEDDGEGGPVLPEENIDQCNACGHCGAVCPVGALVSPKCGGERPARYPDARDLTYPEAEKFLLSCRSMRRYKEEPVAKEEVLALLDVARKAPSASNLQTIRWVVLRGREKASAFTALTMEWFDTVLRHDPVAGPMYNIDGMMARYRSGYDPILRGAPNAVLALTPETAAWGATDGPIAMTYFCLAAHGKGIGSCWCGFGMRALEAYKPLRDLVGIDESVTVQAMAFFGYPELEYHAVPPRKATRISWVG